MSLSLEALALYLDEYFGSMRFPDDPGGIYQPSLSQRPIERLGLSLDPWAKIGVWVERERLDALFIHRPWRLDLSLLPADIGVLAYHLAFDLTLTIGFNQPLASALRMHNTAPFAFKAAIPYGMLGEISPTDQNQVIANLSEIFQHAPRVVGMCHEPIHRIAVVDAMTDSLIREAAAQGIQLYLTGQWRASAKRAVQETGIVVVEIGHATGEIWGLNALADLLQEHWPSLTVVVVASQY